MKVLYKQPDETVNISKVSSLLRFFQIMGGLMVVIVATYIVLGLFVNLAAPYIPDHLERKMGEFIIRSWEVDDENNNIETYQSILEKLVGKESASEYQIMIADVPDFNAVAIPGNAIVVFAGMSEKIDDEELIAFVLAHELGHFKNRDHIKRYGRSMVLALIVNLITGSESALSDFTLEVLTRTEMKFSQKDELAADAYGVELLYDAYGSYEGAIELFEMVNELQKRGKLESYFDSHPHPQKRIEAIEKMILKE